jgi:hypothetical protein
VLATQILLDRKQSRRWANEAEAKLLIENLITQDRMFLWGESAIPLFLAVIWALDKVRADPFSDRLLITMTGALSSINGRLHGPKLPSPYDSADEAIAKILRRRFHSEKQMELRAAASYTLESLVTMITRRLWKNNLAGLWTDVSHVSLARVVPDEPHDLFLWRWEHKRGTEQSRSYDAPQSWQQLLREARRSEDDRLPTAIKEHFDFSLLFLLCYPHRLNTALVKHVEEKVQNI